MSGENDLQEILKREDVAVISDKVSSREELIESLMRYLKLSRANRRYSDYYSVKLYGCNVANMFLTMSYRFKFESPIPVNETFLISEPDLYYNKKALTKAGSISVLLSAIPAQANPCSPKNTAVTVSKRSHSTI